jgi:hypothetical protein
VSPERTLEKMDDFISPKLEGQRFVGHSVPLDMLKDFAALQEMLVEVAKWRFLADNPDRQRTPRNFTADFDLRLTGIEDGSAVLKISLMVASLFPSSHQQYLQKAKTDIVEAVAAAEAGQQPTLPPYLLSYFDRFGRGLKPGESIVFERSGGTARLNSDIRQRLVRYSQVTEFTDEVLVYARVYEADKRNSTFQLEILNGQRLSGPLREPYESVVMDALKTYGKKDVQVISVQGVAKFDMGGKLSWFETVEHVTLTDPLDIDRRVAELSLLKDGWLDGQGSALDPERLRLIGTQFRTRLDPTLPPPFLYPTPEGDLRAEWSLDAAEVSVDISLANLVGQYSALDISSGKSTDETFDLTQDESWTTLNQTLRRLVPEGTEGSRG